MGGLQKNYRPDVTAEQILSMSFDPQLGGHKKDPFWGLTEQRRY
jgi:hypothetical protein